MSNLQTTIAKLNLLIETCNDGAKGFESAANAVDSMQYRRLLTQFSQQRRRFAIMLRGIVLRYGGIPEQRETPLIARLHRAWLSLRAVFSRNKTWAVLDECERGEYVAVSNYERALAIDLPAGIRPIINEQFAAVQATYNRIHAMRELALNTA